MEHFTEKQGCLRQNDMKMMELEPWGEFSCVDGWGGYLPSAAYFVAVHLQVGESKGEFMRRSLQMIDAQIIAGDAL